ncbi:MAG: hypothetical protein J5859_03500 [Clostridia bacterium]|nr:hypothetical protein [Clostridia bacterium]
MKRTIAFILTIVIVSMLLIPAFASEGDITMDFSENDVYFSRSVTDGSTVYFMNDTQVYTWKRGETGYAEYQIDLEALLDDDADGSLWPSVIGAYFDDGEVCIVVAIQGLDDDNNYGFDGVYGARLTFKDGTAIPEIATPALDWELLTEYYEDSAYARYVNDCVVVDGVIYVLSYGDIGPEVFAIPLNGKYAQKLEDISEPVGMGAYKEGSIFFIQYDYNKPEKASFISYDTDSETISDIGEIDVENYSLPNGIVYSEEADAFYYCEKGSVVRHDIVTGEKTTVNDIISSSYSIQTAFILDDGSYAGCTYSGFFTRNTDPEKMSDRRIMICSSGGYDAVQKAYAAFINEHGDVSVGISNDYVEDSVVTEAMLNRVADYDIYVIPAYMGAYSACFKRGYTAELTGNAKIDALFAEMYPSIAASFSKNGEILAVPISSYAYGFGVSERLLEKGGLSLDDIPSNWADFIEWIPEGAKLFEGTDVILFDQWLTEEQLRTELFSMIFQDYMKYLNYAGQEQGYNTDLLYNLLKAVEDADFSALNLREASANGDEEDDDEFWETEYNDSLETLFASYVSQTAGSYYADFVPVAMSLTEDTPFIIEMQMNVAFVNPFSRNRETAVEYLGYIVENLEAGHLSNISPERNEPVRSSYYATEKKYIDEQIASLQEALADCSEEDRQALEATLEDMYSWQESMEKSYWEVSPDGIEWLRAHDDIIVVSTYNPLYTDNEGVISDLVSQYVDHSIDLRTLLVSIDKKVQMMYLEEN